MSSRADRCRCVARDAAAKRGRRGTTEIRLQLPVPEEVGRHHQPLRRLEEECHLLVSKSTLKCCQPQPWMAPPFKSAEEKPQFMTEVAGITPKTAWIFAVLSRWHRRRLVGAHGFRIPCEQVADHVSSSTRAGR